MKEREDTASLAYKNAETAFLVGEYDKAIEEFLSVSREYQDTSYRQSAVGRVGDVYYRQKKYDRAISYYQRSLKVPGELWWPEDSVENYARADYMIGVCHFDQDAMNRAFAHFRRFVQRHPESRLVDRAYDFIGRGNMKMKRYGQAIDAFRMVGTARLKRQMRRTVAPGEELYVRVVDADVGLASRHATLPVRIKTTSGDDEVMALSSLGLGSPIFLGTIRTRLGAPRLTRTLDEAFTRELKAQLEQWLRTADDLDEEAKQIERKAATLPQPAADPAAADPAAALAAAKKKRDDEASILTNRAKELAAGAAKLRRETYAGLDGCFVKIEKILKDWGTEDSTSEEQPAAETKKDVAAEEDGLTGEKKDKLSEVFSQEEIRRARTSAAAEPTTEEKGFRYRLALLEYWHRQLLQEYKTLDLNGSDTVAVEYLDGHGATEDGKTRIDSLSVASDATILCVGPSLINTVSAVVLGDEVRVKIIDPDMDVSPARDTVQVMVASIEKVVTKGSELEDSPEDEEGDEAEDPAGEQLLFEDEVEEEMPELTPKGAPYFVLACTETGPHTGEFVGAFPTVDDDAGSVTAKLALSPKRLVRAGYADKRTNSRSGEWVVVTELELVEGSEGEHQVIEKQESRLDRRSELEKGIALGKLARVYQDLGLRADAQATFDEALKVVKAVVVVEKDSPLGEEATYQMWDLYFASGDEQAAAEACAKLIATFPNSPLADDALLIMGKAEKEPRRAMAHFQRLISRYPDSPLAPEAQFRVAELRYAEGQGQFDVAAYEACANKYPESNYAAESLLRLSEYYIENKDFTRARDYLERIELDYPDFERLDKSTYLRGVCAYRTGEPQLAYSLMHEILEKYPGTPLSKSAAKIAKLLERKIKAGR